MQENIWESEYQNPKLIRLDDNPTKAVVRFSKYLRKNIGLNLSGVNILDLGCGIAKNGIFLADFDKNKNSLTGIDISSTALKYANNFAKETGIQANFIKQSIGTNFPFPDSVFDIILDVTSSNSLSEIERKKYLNEMNRVLKPNGHIFIRALCKDGDTNAKNLLISNPGKEKDTYIMPEINLTERVFTKEDFISTYSDLFDLKYIEKEIHYTKFNKRSYKRNFWISYWEKAGSTKAGSRAEAV